MIAINEMYVCKARNGEEIDGFERHTTDLLEFLEILGMYKEVHVQSVDEKIDLWIKLKGGDEKKNGSNSKGKH